MMRWIKPWDACWLAKRAPPAIWAKSDEAIALARQGYETYPSAESAREIARWLVKAGHDQEALAPYADAFAIPDSRNTDIDRAKDRAQLGDTYRKVYGSEKGMGDLILEAYDRTAGLLEARRLRLRQNDPNAQASNVMDVTLSGVDGGKLPIASLKGKAVIFDFWATWCGPCRMQHPLYEQVKQRFHDSPDVVFLSIATDDEREIGGALPEGQPLGFPERLFRGWPVARAGHYLDSHHHRSGPPRRSNQPHERIPA